MPRAARHPLLLLLTACLPACVPDAAPEELRLVQVFPPSGPIYLNQRIDLIFDRPVDPSTVTDDTLRIVDEEGGLAVPGTLHAVAHSLRVSFEPLPPVSSDLADGSFRPGRRYRLTMPVYPRSNAMRGAAGELLRSAPRVTWQAVDPADLPPDLPTALMPSSQGGPLRLRHLPSVEAEAGRIVLSFDRALYPPSVRLSSFRLEEGLRSGREIPLRSVRVLPGDGGRVPYGSQIELRAGRQLSPGLYGLWVAPGIEGPTDAAYRPLELDRGDAFGLQGPSGERLLPFEVSGGPDEPVLEERFRAQRAALTEDPEKIGLPGRVDGMLEWGSKGLQLPPCGFEDFAALGSLRGTETRTLRPGAHIRTRENEWVLPPETWDFEEVFVPRGSRLYLILERTIRIRVRGRFEVAGELIVRFGSGIARPPRPDEEMGPVPPKGPELALFWQRFEPRLEVEVAGLARLDGRITVEGRPQALVGYLRARGPLLGDWRECALQGLLRQPGDFASSGPAVHGRLAAVSPFYGFADHPEILGQLELVGPGRGGIEILLQAMEPGRQGSLSAWLRPERGAEFGPLAELRFAVLVRGAGDTGPGLLLESLRLR